MFTLTNDIKAFFLIELVLCLLLTSIAFNYLLKQARGNQLATFEIKRREELSNIISTTREAIPFALSTHVASGKNVSSSPTAINLPIHKNDVALSCSSPSVNLFSCKIELLNASGADSNDARLEYSGWMK